MRKFVSLLISASLILMPCFVYADTASGSALSLDEQLWIMSEGGIQPVQVAALEAGSIKAAGDPGSSTNPYYFLSVGRNATVYYATNSTNSTSTSYYVDDLGDVVQGITQSIAYSIQNQRNLWSTIGTNTVSAINDVWNRLGTIGGYVDGLESQMTTNNTRLGTIDTAVGNIKSKVDSIYSSIDNLEGYTDDVESSLSSILSAILNQSFDLGTFIPNFMPGSSYDFSSSAWTNVTRRVVLSDGSSSSSVFSSPYMILQLRELLRATNNAAALSYDKMFNYVLGSDYADANYHVIFSPLTGNQVTLFKRSFWVDFRTVSRYITRGLSLITALDPNAEYCLTDATNSTRVVSDISIGDYIRQLGEELSFSVGRLAYVLANDDDIIARNVAANNTHAAVTNILSGQGSAAPTDITGVANLKSSAVGSLSSGVSANTIFSETGVGGHAWDWFSQTVADELSAPSRRSNVRSNSKSSGSDTPMLDAYYHDLEEVIGFKLPW